MNADDLTTLSTTDMAHAAESARAYVDDARAPSTRRAYQASWRAFEAWCAAGGLQPLPATPEAVAVYLASLADAGRAVASIERALVGISQAHRMAKLPSPRESEVVRSVVKGIRRRVGVAQCQKAPLLPEQLRMLLETMTAGRQALRDRALLVLGFAGGFRRSELVGLDLGDVVFSQDGLIVSLRRSKTDQEGSGRKIGIPFGYHVLTCPVRSLRAWLDEARIESGPLFRSVSRHGVVAPRRLDGGSVGRIIQRLALRAGLDAAQYGGHSLRAGLATAAAKAGKSERAIMAQTGHRSVTMVRRYIRDADLFGENAAAGIGL